ncbi:preprotein translocase subunit SecE [Candidatus Wolfebacteria bacterium]|nr:preprotein translocase subunit SecE [Candidatus Wolfebacteria bacterium]
MMFSRLKSYIQESYQEFHRVNWPTRQETVRMTLVVIVMSLAMAVFLGAADFLFSYLLEKFLIG